MAARMVLTKLTIKLTYQCVVATNTNNYCEFNNFFIICHNKYNC